MAHLLPSMVLLLVAAMVLVAPAASSGWVHNPSCTPRAKYQKLGESAVKKYNEHIHGKFKLIGVEDCYVLDRGSDRYSHRFSAIVDGGKKIKTEVLEDLSIPGVPPVHKFGHFHPH
ncbi:unnamed protein product [Victoria cruziana]